MIYLWDNIGGRISEEFCHRFLMEFCLKFWHILHGWRFCFGLVGCFLDRNHPGETYWRHLFEPDWSETSLRSIVRANLAISPRNLSSSIEYRCVWLPTPPSPGLPQGSGGNGMRWYPNSRACRRSRKVSPIVFRTLMRVRCQEKVLRIVCEWTICIPNRHTATKQPKECCICKSSIHQDLWHKIWSPILSHRYISVSFANFLVGSKAESQEL